MPKARLGRGWKEWLKAFFRRIGMPGRVAVMARWGREHYGITEPDNKKAIKQLAVILMGKQTAGAFAPVTVRRDRKIKSHAVSVAMPAGVNIRPVRAQSKQDFYSSWAWKKLRYKVLKKYGAKCMLCGRTAADGAKICVDHIKPRALFPELELVESNLQVLCDACNMGKGRWDKTDWRKKWKRV